MLLLRGGLRLPEEAVSSAMDTFRLAVSSAMDTFRMALNDAVPIRNGTTMSSSLPSVATKSGCFNATFSDAI